MNPALGLAAGRVVIGGIVLGSPEVGAKLFRLDPAANPQMPYMARLFGSREIVLGAATLLARGKTQRNLILAGIGVDAADAAAAVLGGQEGTLDRTTQVMLTVPAALAVVAGVVGLRRRS
jgi:hypothetical protein